jgi:hypothetical protein
MNRLKRLFSPSALAATVATGMLLTSVALAQNCLSAHAVWNDDPPLQCQNGFICTYSPDPCNSDEPIYWCCASGDSCGQNCGVYPTRATCDKGSTLYAYGWCCAGGCD